MDTTTHTRRDDRARALARLRSLTIGISLAGTAATVGLGLFVAGTTASAATTTNGTTTNTIITAANGTTTTSAATPTQSTTTSSGTVSSSSGRGQVSTGGS